jgi:Flp pilus assembly protein TadD
MGGHARIAAALLACLWLGGCNGVEWNDLVFSATPAAQAEAPHLADTNPPLLDATRAAKEAFLQGNYGQSEEMFQRIVERQSDDPEAWLGLAASYDQLRRFDLADRAYAQLTKLVGPTVVVHNNRGYSYLMRGDRARARREFLAARALDPQNAFVLNNLRTLNGQPTL